MGDFTWAAFFAFEYIVISHIRPKNLIKSCIVVAFLPPSKKHTYLNSTPPLLNLIHKLHPTNLILLQIL
jgi:hypothetical protein